MVVVALLLQHRFLGVSAAAPPPTGLPAKTGNPVVMATLPVSAPLGVISEVMRRDAILAKALQERGRSLDLLPFVKGRDMLPAMINGDIDIALVGDLPALEMAVATDIVIAALAKLGSGGIVSHKRHTTLADLRGKRIGVPQGANVYYGLLVALETADMTEGDVEIVFLEPNELLPALLGARIEAMSIWPPLLESALADHPGLICLQRFVNASYVVLRRSFVDQAPEAAALVLAAYLRSLRWMKDDPGHLLLAAGWAKECAEEFQKSRFAPLELICATTDHDILAYAANPSIPQTDREEGGQLYQLFTFLQRKSKLPQSTTWPRLQRSLDRNLLRGILSQPEKYLLNTFDYGHGS